MVTRPSRKYRPKKLEWLKQNTTISNNIGYRTIEKSAGDWRFVIVASICVHEPNCTSMREHELLCGAIPHASEKKAVEGVKAFAASFSEHDKAALQEQAQGFLEQQETEKADAIQKWLNHEPSPNMFPGRPRRELERALRKKPSPEVELYHKRREKKMRLGKAAIDAQLAKRQK